jgi:hypothetical protein
MEEVSGSEGVSLSKGESLSKKAIGAENSVGFSDNSKTTHQTTHQKKGARK